MDGLEVDKPGRYPNSWRRSSYLNRKEPRRVTWLARAVREQAGLGGLRQPGNSCRAMKTGAERHMQHFSGKVHLKQHPPEAQEVCTGHTAWNGSYYRPG